MRSLNDDGGCDVMHSAVLASPCNIDCDNDRDCDVGTPSLSPGPQPHENRDRRGWELRYGETFPAPRGLDNDNGGCVVGRPLLPASAASTVIRCTPPSLAAPRSLDDDHEDWNVGTPPSLSAPQPRRRWQRILRYGATCYLRQLLQLR
jgi:hypothetical protein